MASGLKALKQLNIYKRLKIDYFRPNNSGKLPKPQQQLLAFRVTTVHVGGNRREANDRRQKYRGT